jgi:8-hydroxy-5-deazaflavin:NADPH oxidoreductase
MRYAVLGTGPVGQAVAGKLADLGHDVVMGSRTADNPKALEWAEGTSVRVATFADAAASAEAVVNATGGVVTLAVLEAVGAGNLAGKVLIDISNALDPTSGFPPTFTVANDDSLGEQIQRAYPDARVVKALNTMTAAVMVDPAIVPGEHVVFVCGDDAGAKAQVTAMLGEIGWPAPRVVDLGGIANARGVEMYVALWIRLYGALGTGLFNIALLRG